MECPKFDGCRVLLSRYHNLKDDWWLDQPRVTAKTGWITLAADSCPDVRAAAQVAACKLGIMICDAFDGGPHAGQMRPETVTAGGGAGQGASQGAGCKAGSDACSMLNVPC